MNDKINDRQFDVTVRFVAQSLDMKTIAEGREDSTTVIDVNFDDLACGACDVLPTLAYSTSHLPQRMR